MNAVLVLPNSLLEHHPLITRDTLVLVYEHPRYFCDFTYHVQKLIFHRTTLTEHYEFLKNKGYRCEYIEYDESLSEILTKKRITTLLYCAPGDRAVDAYIAREARKADCSVERHHNPIFLTTEHTLEELLGDKDHYLMAGFYTAQRKRLDILLTSQGKPLGGKWSFDAENRKRLPTGKQIPTLSKVRATEKSAAAHAWQKKHFPKAPGESAHLLYPTTYNSARRWLDTFLEERFIHFGDYQDAIVPDENFLFHSVLSPLINVGLLTPEYVIKQALAFAHDHKKISLNNLEGFVRQIIGWREFVYGIYHLRGEQQRTANFFNHSRTIPRSWWHAKTEITPVDTAIDRVLKTAYTHHIERLMVLGNFMLLCEFDPTQVYTWFMELFIDAYDWVMVPNVYGMSQYADGGLMTTKPYISGSAYIKRMSSYKSGPWCAVWDALYWHFIIKHEKIIASNARLSAMAMYLRRMSREKRELSVKLAQRYLASLDE